MNGNNIRRPKRGDQEEDLLKFQEEFLRNKGAEQPAAKVIKISKPINEKIKEDSKMEIDIDCMRKFVRLLLQ